MNGKLTKIHTVPGSKERYEILNVVLELGTENKIINKPNKCQVFRGPNLLRRPL